MEVPFSTDFRVETRSQQIVLLHCYINLQIFVFFLNINLRENLHSFPLTLTDLLHI